MDPLMILDRSMCIWAASGKTRLLLGHFSLKLNIEIRCTGYPYGVWTHRPCVSHICAHLENDEII